ncbi:MAG: hypothetical protein KDN20_24560 [Verrucomicrobiae bacterium]|nr:hypothetical protein [Verrucomicrobiae bacterium]
MNENKLKHLEFIQNIIARMSTNSFMVKGWSVTLVAAIFALAASEANQSFAVVVFLPIIAFWVLDSFFLFQERGFRALYRKVADKPEDQINFEMDPSTLDKTDLKAEKAGWWKVCCSPSLWLFHGALLIVTLLVMYVIPKSS